MSVKGKCLSQRKMLNVIFAQAIISVVSDFGLAFYPILILWKLQMKTKNKVGLCFLMGLGVM